MHLLPPLLPRPFAYLVYLASCATYVMTVVTTYPETQVRSSWVMQLPLSSSGLSSYQWAAPRGSLLPLTPLPEPGLHYYCPPQRSGWLAVPPALYLLICLHHKCDHAISCLSPSRSSPHLQGHVQSAPQVTGTVWFSSCSSLHGPSTDLTLATSSHWYSLDGPTSHDMTQEGRWSHRRNKNLFTLKTQFKHPLLQFLPPESPSGTTPSLWPYPRIQASGSVWVNCYWSS